MILNRISPSAFDAAISSPVELAAQLRAVPARPSRKNPNNNKQLKVMTAKPDEGNESWLGRAMKEQGDSAGLLLFGGTSVADFHIRVAQSQLRYDLTPGHWSMVGIAVDEETFLTVPMQWQGDLDDMPHSNSIQKFRIADFDDRDRWPNVAFIRFTSDMSAIVKHAEAMVWQRSVVDLPELVIRWLEYVWGVQNVVNPLTIGKGIPSAVFAEVAFGIAALELTPGLASSSSCPEAIWQAAKWWHKFYAETTQSMSQTPAIVPAGNFLIRQRSAAIRKKR